MNRTWTWRIVGAVICLLAGNFGPRGYVAWRLAETRHWREKVAVKAIGDEIPLEVLDVIHRSPFPAAVVLALIEVESDGDPNALSPDGRHVGLLMVKRIYAKKFGYAEDDLFDPVINVTIGLALLAEERTRYKGVEYHYISAHNVSKDRMAEFIKRGRPLPGETRRHWARYRKHKRRLERWIDRGEWWE